MLFPPWPPVAQLVAGFGDRRSAAPGALVLVRQVHGDRLVSGDDLSPGRHTEIEADALAATRAGVIVGVQTADCVPVLLVAERTRSDDSRWAAAVHAGWRGTVADVVGTAVSDARARGHSAERLFAAIGPSIGPCCYEVGEDVAAHFRRLALPVVDGGGKPRLDLRAVNRELLLRHGLAPSRICMCSPCTQCEADRYHSYRAAGPNAGRQTSWIGWEPAVAAGS